MPELVCGFGWLNPCKDCIYWCHEELVSFDISALFTSIPVDQALDMIIQLIRLTWNLNPKLANAGMKSLINLDREELMLLLKVILNNCVFSFQEKFFKQLQWVLLVC